MDELERLPRMELTIDQPVPADIFDEHGRLIARRGAALKAHEVEAMRRRPLYRRKHRPGGDTRDATNEQAGESAVSADERRQFQRQAWDAPLSLNVDDPNAGEQQITVNARDVSAGGIGFIADRPIAKGVVIHVRFEDVPDAPRIRSVVRSCVKLPDEQGYRVGIEFVGR